MDAFADELARQGFGNKSITLYDIRAELNHRYKDLRIPYESPSRERIFTMLTKETPASIGQLSFILLCTAVGLFLLSMFISIIWKLLRKLMLILTDVVEMFE